MSDDILIVGGGFAGFWAALAAKRHAGARASVTLASREPVLQMRPRLYEANPQSLAVELAPLLNKVDVRFVQDIAVGLDATARRVGFASGEQRPYTRLIVATGSAMRRPEVPGADEAYAIDTLAEAIAFDRRLAEIAVSERQPIIAIVGAGFTGVELALEMRDRLGIHGGEGVAERAHIVLINRANVVGATLGAGPRPTIEAALAAARVELLLGASVTALAADRVTFADGSVLEADAVVLTTGMEASPFARLVPGERDEQGRILVDQSLRVAEAPEIFVAGDAAAADTGDGQRTLQSCQHALQLGRFAGENAARDLLGEPTLPYRQARYVTCLDLGRSGAVFTEGWERAVQQNGAEAKAIKRRINGVVIYPPQEASGEELLALSSTDLAAQRRP